MKIRGLIFDLDGTLGDTIPVCVLAYQRTFERHLGRSFSAPEIVAMFGPDEEGILKRQLADAWPQALATYVDEYERAHRACPAPFPGLLPLLGKLRRRGVRLGIVTGKGERTARISARIWGLDAYFDGIEAGAAEGPIKPIGMRAFLARWGIAPREAAYVGDAPYDVDAAKEVAVVSVAAAWAGSTDVASLAARRPDHLFTRVEELAQWAERVVPR